MHFATADLCDAYPTQVGVSDVVFADYGGLSAFCGPIATVKAYEDNSKVQQMLATPGDRRVLVIDGAGSRRYALLGDHLGELAVRNEWAGLVVFGCVRDVVGLQGLSIGVRALGVCPRRTEKNGIGLVNVPIVFGGVEWRPGHWLYADPDGLITSPQDLR